MDYLKTAEYHEDMEINDFHIESLFRGCFLQIAASKFPEYGVFEDQPLEKMIKYMNVDLDLKKYGIKKN